MSHHDDAIHPASLAHLQQARQRGQVAKSQELSAAIQLTFCIAACWFLFSMAGQRMQEFASETWNSERVTTEYTTVSFSEDMRQGLLAAGTGILPLLGIVLVVGIVSHYVQTGPMWLGGSAMPDPSRMSPSHWWGQVFSMRGASRSVLGVPKLAVVFSTTGLIMWYRRGILFESTSLEVAPMLDSMAGFVFGSCLSIAAVLLVMSTLDFAIEFFGLRQRLRMTDQQMRDEQRTQSVDPQITNQRRRLQREWTGTQR